MQLQHKKGCFLLYLYYTGLPLKIDKSLKKLHIH